MMASARTGPLLLILVTLGSWVLLRSLFIVLSVPVSGLPLPLIAADNGDFASALPPPFLPRSGAQLAVPSAVRPLAPLHRSLRQPQSLALLEHTDRPATVRPIPAAPRNSGVVSAQALLLGRMMASHSRAVRSPAYESPALVSAGPLASFIPTRRPPRDSWSLSAGVYVRSADRRTSITPVPTLGGTQAWARIGWRPGPTNTEIFARANSAGGLGDGAEAAIGVAHRPIAGLPVQLVAERRQRIGRDGRSAFAAYAVGGASTELGGWRVDGYGAAGVVGAVRRDRFAEGSVTLVRPVARFGSVELSAGGGAWAAAQPGVERVDIGPRLTVRSEQIEGALLAIDWRQRVAGNASPESGPALILSVDF